MLCNLTTKDSIFPKAVNLTCFGIKHNEEKIVTCNNMSNGSYLQSSQLYGNVNKMKFCNVNKHWKTIMTQRIYQLSKCCF